jgi:hypothetical protein
MRSLEKLKPLALLLLRVAVGNYSDTLMKPWRLSLTWGFHDILPISPVLLNFSADACSFWVFLLGLRACYWQEKWRSRFGESTAFFRTLGRSAITNFRWCSLSAPLQSHRWARD